MGLVQLAAFETSLKVAVIADIVLFCDCPVRLGDFYWEKCPIPVARTE